MESFRYKPLEGLLKLQKENYKSITLLETLTKVEEDISPSPKDRAKRLMLFFYLIDILQSNNIPFYVKGGVILQYYLEDHARDTNDIDLLIPMDADIFYSSIKKAFENNEYGLTIKVKHYSKKEAEETYYFPTFSMLLSISLGEEDIDTILLEGTYGDLFSKVTPKEYRGPSIIKDNFSFLGVSLECVFADKILTITSELARPYKHLVDAYSISQINVNIKELRRYLDIILAFENKMRNKLGINIDDYRYEITSEKKFTHNYYFPLIQSGYIIEFNDMVEHLNQYMHRNLK